MARQDSIAILTTAGGQAKLDEIYGKFIANVMKKAISTEIKNTNLSGDPEAGSFMVSRYADAQVKDYGTARTAGKGDKFAEDEVEVKLNKHKEIVEEYNKSDVRMKGVFGQVTADMTRHEKSFVRELDRAFFKEAIDAGTEHETEATNIVDIIDEMICAVEETENSFIDGIELEDITMVVDPTTHKAIKKYIEENPQTDTNTKLFHEVELRVSNRMKSGDTKAAVIVMMKESIAQPVISEPTQAEKVNLGNEVAVETFFDYGTKAVTPETILFYAP